MKANDAPPEQYIRLGLDPDGSYDAQRVLDDRRNAVTFDSFPVTAKYQWEPDARNIFVGMLSLMGDDRVDEYLSAFEQVMEQAGTGVVTRAEFEQLAHRFYSDNPGKVFYFLNKLARIR